jgi:hypothetical protein
MFRPSKTITREEGLSRSESKAEGSPFFAIGNIPTSECKEGMYAVLVENINPSICKQMVELLGDMLGVSS